MSENTPFAKIGEAFEAHQSFAVVSHVRPDGDAIGSILALGHALEQMGKSVRYLNNDGCPESLAFLPGSEKVEVSSEAKNVDVEVAITLDTAAHARLGEGSLQAIKDAKMTKETIQQSMPSWVAFCTMRDKLGPSCDTWIFAYENDKVHSWICGLLRYH